MSEQNSEFAAVHLPRAFVVRATQEAAKRGLTVEGYIVAAVEGANVEQRREKCLCPVCPLAATSLGLCRNHYQKACYYRDKGNLTEAWLVRHGRMAPRFSNTLVVPDSLETLPVMPRRRIFEPDILWLFDYPESQKERKRLEEAAKIQAEGSTP